MNQNSRKNRATIDRFVVHKRLGEGFQGTVYLAWDPNLERKVALKVITLAKSDVDVAVEVIREARIAARISHPNVIPIYEVGLYHNAPLLVLEYVNGVTLGQYLKRKGRITEKEALSMMLGITAGLSYAHNQGIVHLDISPNNIMVDSRGHPRIMDFGLARLTTNMEKKRSGNIVYGTPRYLSPEHVLRAQFTPATDIFSLGLLFFELLAGKPAIDFDEMNEILRAVGKAHIDWGKLQHLDLTPEVIAVVRDMLQVNPEWRYQDATELLPALNEVNDIKQKEDRGSVAIDFLLRRLERRPEFPACSASIGEINRLTEEGSNADFNKLGAVIVRDYTLTNRVLKIANSVIFDRNSEGVTTISVAIARLGLKLVRMICNGLLLFGQADDKNDELKDILVASFVAGLIARHIMTSIKRRNAEEAFICGLFHKLGTHLLVFYLADEYEDIEVLVAKGLGRQQAERAVLSTTCASLGAAVSEKWNFPETIRNCMKQLPDGVLSTPANDEEMLCQVANMANELCDMVNSSGESIDIIVEIKRFQERHRSIYNSDLDRLAQLADATAEKFSDLAPGLGINYDDSRFCRKLAGFAAAIEAAQEEIPEVALA